MTRAELRAEQADCVARMKSSPDEFHPDFHVAAAFADRNANEAAQNWLSKEVAKLEAKTKVEASSRDLVQLGITRRLLQQAKWDRREIDERCEACLPPAAKAVVK